MEGKGKVGRRIGKGRGGRERETEAGRWAMYTALAQYCVSQVVHNGDWLLAVADTVSERFVTTNY